MNKRMVWSRILCIVELAMIPIEVALGNLTLRVSGWFALALLLAFDFLPGLGSGLAALGALLSKSRYRRFMYGASVLTLCGMIALFLLAANVEAPAAASWGVAMYAYPIGAIMSLVGAGLVLVESFRKPLVPKDNVERNANYPSF
ncbi:hypothetical protein [Candidatus Cryosericum terrychapinii]|jgi:hypothetical protein|uniref:Uncharacterized protein n=1 Tax=Candidatus Cryosericum terrychapinii TaxID=2290919 RepID=A0A398CSU9_9BACT|nr:hypothetical protein [Candidatus Cryosericum terrychapinii]RIE05685.1 hypothetical protein SMC7_05895 [Candidatus Cryosericum terrychapinii]